MKTFTTEEREERAFADKERGNKLYAQKKYRQAIESYRSAIKWIPPPPLHAICLSNESAAHGGMGNWDKAEACARSCIAVVRNF